MIKLRTLSSSIASIALSGVVILSCSGLVVSAGQKGKEMHDSKEAMHQTIEKNARLYQHEYNSYSKYIEIIKKEIIDTNMANTAMDVFAAYVVLQERGLISLGDTFEFGVADYDIVGNLGMSIVSGKGVCRNQAYNLFRIFDALGYEASVSCGELFNSTFTNGNNNHAVTVVKENGKYYLFDPANKTVYLRTLGGQYKSIDDNGDKYYPSAYGDEMFLNLQDNAGLHMYLADDYKDKGAVRDNRDESIRKALSNVGYYDEYERHNLIMLERDITNGIREKIENEAKDEEYRGLPVIVR